MSEHPIDKGRIDKAKRLVDELLAELDKPPHMVMMITGDEESGDESRVASVMAQVSEKLKLPHFEMMIGAILANLAEYDHEAVIRLCALAEHAAHIAVAKYQEKLRGIPPQNLN